MPGGPLGIPVRQVLQVGANFNGVQEVPDVCFVWVGSRGPITGRFLLKELELTTRDLDCAASLPATPYGCNRHHRHRLRYCHHRRCLTRGGARRSLSTTTMSDTSDKVSVEEFVKNPSKYKIRRDFVAHLKREGLKSLLHDDHDVDSERQYKGFEMLRASVKLVQQFPRQVVLATAQLHFGTSPIRFILLT